VTTDALADAERALLAAVVATLLPGGRDWPAAADLDLTDETIRLAGLSLAGLAPLRRLLSSLPAGFPEAGADAREAALAALEAADPAAFGAGMQAAYNAYYIDPRVLAVVAAKTGYRPGAPQPDGFELPPFDEALVAVARTRAPHWRPA
jgi:hypothetical protein